ncbi:MAG: TetR/AcrR family transcriptional regulator [Acidimicrobiales bacterium]
MKELEHDDFAVQARRFAERLDLGTSFAATIHATTDAHHHPRIVEAATAMLRRTGSLDMKQLAREVGLSRASLYRYYPDKSQLAAEIAALGLDGMERAAAPFDARPTSSGRPRNTWSPIPGRPPPWCRSPPACPRRCWPPPSLASPGAPASRRCSSGWR